VHNSISYTLSCGLDMGLGIRVGYSALILRTQLKVCEAFACCCLCEAVNLNGEYGYRMALNSGISHG